MTKRFDRAVAQWDKLKDSEREADFNAMEAAERIILAHRPTNAFQAQAMTRVLAFNMQTGERSDGLDRVSLEALTAWRLASADIPTLSIWPRNPAVSNSPDNAAENIQSPKS